jgi:hypothetical protein
LKVFSDFGVRIVDEAFHFLYCSMWIPSFGHLVIFKARCMLDFSNCTKPPCLAIVDEMLKTYRKLVASSKSNLQLVSQPYTTQWADCKVIEACFVHSQRCLTGGVSCKITELTVPWCLISQTAWINSIVNLGSLPLWAAKYWSPQSLHIRVVGCIISWPLSTSLWRYLHPIPCRFICLLHPVLGTIFKCAAWVIFLVAAIAVSQWTN